MTVWSSVQCIFMSLRLTATPQPGEMGNAMDCNAENAPDLLLQAARHLPSALLSCLASSVTTHIPVQAGRRGVVAVVGAECATRPDCLLAGS